MDDPEALLAFLEPLKAVRAYKLKVELNWKLPTEVIRLLGPVEYDIVFRERPFDEHFRSWSLRDSVDLEKL